MRLLNTSSYRLKEFPDAVEAPPYAILSHTWGDHEIKFDDVNGKGGEDQGWLGRESAKKIRMSAKQARRDGLRYIWIDNICIDKSSSMELSEAINSMFNWYRLSRVCYAYLADVQEVKDLDRCRWLSRGWTLQELIAPCQVEFYGEQWSHIGSRDSLADKLETLTKINKDLLSQRHQYSPDVEHTLKTISIATRMSWASNRNTTRREDIAYCLMGIFGVNMPLLYGEGDKAFQRLQQEILKDTTDFTILAYETEENATSSLLAPHPRSFRHMLSALSQESSPPVRSSSQQITFEALLCPFGNAPGSKYYGLILDCYFGRNVFSRPVLLLECLDTFKQIYVRTNYQRVYRLEEPNVLIPYDIFVPGALEIDKAFRPVITMKLRTFLPQASEILPPLKFSIAHGKGLPFSYETVNSMPKICDNIIHHLPVLPTRKRECGYAAGIVAISRQSDFSDYPSPLSQAAYSITWGMRDGTEPWCKLWTNEAILRRRLSDQWWKKPGKKPGSKEEEDTLIDDSLEAALHGRSLIPPFFPGYDYSTDMIIDQGIPAHTLTATIKLSRFLGQPRLDLKLTISLDSPTNGV
ncbi:HET-domain-containing protein [Apiospora arundinis]|uniref:HET-domain-containing protein n=1 Tax=Apiospora arundinis TaxID=335852 RepID=A0ABR2IS35_9PEZI